MIIDCGMAVAHSPLTTRSPGLHQMAPRDVSGTISVIIELIMVIINLLPIIVVLKWKRGKERLVTDELIVALSIADILSVFVPTPLGLVSYFNKSWQGGKETCEFYQLTTIWFLITSVFLITYMCVDRLMSLRYAIVCKNTTTNVNTKVRLFVLSIFLTTLIVSSLPVMGLGPKPLSYPDGQCENWITSMPSEPQEHVFYIVIITIGFINLGLTLLSNVWMLFLIWRYKKRLRLEDDLERRAGLVHARMDGKTVLALSWMIITITITFYLTWFPSLLMITLQKCGLDISEVSILYAMLSTSLTGLVNPLIYGLFAKGYRRGYKRILVGVFRCLCCRRGFQSVPAVSMDVRSRRRVLSKQKHRCLPFQPRMRRSKSLHDSPSGQGLVNLAFHATSSCHIMQDDELQTYPEITEDRPRERRAHSLSPPNNRMVIICQDANYLSNYDPTSSTSSSTLGSSEPIGSSEESDEADESSDDDTQPRIHQESEM